MFTGLVAEAGTVRRIEGSEEGSRLELEAGLAAELTRGDSVAVNGVCLTAVDASNGRFEVDVIAETLARSTLGGLREGDRVNLELPLRAQDRLGGHIVQGHVDGVGTVEAVEAAGSSRRVSVRADAALCRYLVDRGSVALDGVSLTVTGAAGDGFTVALIPETIERTTLGELAVGDPVNLEVDLVAKYVEKLARPQLADAVMAEASR